MSPSPPTGPAHPSIFLKFAFTRTYYLARFIDKSGSGCADIAIDVALRWLGISRKTFNRDLKQLKEKGFIRHYELNKATRVVRVWYVSLFKVARTLGLDDLGIAVKEISITELRRSLRTPLATEVIALRSQKQAQYTVEQHNQQGLERLVRPELLLRQDRSSSNSQGVNLALFYGKRYIFLSSDAILTGATQKLIAQRLGISRTTVQRHLSNVNRMTRGIHPIYRRQQAVEADPAILFEIQEWNGTDLNIGRDHYFISRGKAWKVGPNLYCFRANLTLSSKKTSRYWYKRWLCSQPLPVNGLSFVS